MPSMKPFRLAASLVCIVGWSIQAQASQLAGTAPLLMQGDLSAQMVEGIDRFLMRQIDESVTERQVLWHRDFASREAYDKSVEPNLEHLRRAIGAVDKRVPIRALEYLSTTEVAAKVAETATFTVTAVRWPVFEGVHGEGLLLEPKAPLIGRVIVLPDADQTP